MNVIIVVASKHGSTRAIATTIGDDLAATASPAPISIEPAGRP